MSNSVYLDQLPCHLSYQTQEEREIEEFQQLCLWIKKNGNSSELAIVEVALQLLETGKSNPFFSLSNYLNAAKPILQNMKEGIASNRLNYGFHRQENAQNLSTILDKIQGAKHLPLLQLQKGKTQIHWLEKTKNTIASLGNYLPKQSFKLPIEERKKAFREDLEAGKTERELLLSYSSHLKGLSTEEHQEFVQYASNLVKGKTINALARVPANIHKALVAIFKFYLMSACAEASAFGAPHTEYTLEELLNGSKQAFRGEIPEFNRIVKEITPDLVLKIGEGFSWVDEKFQRFDHHLQKKYYTEEGIVHDAAWGMVDIGAPLAVAKAVGGIKYLAKGVISSVPMQNSVTGLFESSILKAANSNPYYFVNCSNSGIVNLFNRYTQNLLKNVECYCAAAGIYKIQKLLLNAVPYSYDLETQLVRRFPPNAKIKMEYLPSLKDNLILKASDGSTSFIGKHSKDPGLIMREVYGMNFLQAHTEYLPISKICHIGKSTYKGHAYYYVIKEANGFSTMAEVMAQAGQLPLSSYRGALFSKLEKGWYHLGERLGDFTLRGMRIAGTEEAKMGAIYEIIEQAKRRVIDLRQDLAAIGYSLPENTKLLVDVLSSEFEKDPGRLSYLMCFTDTGDLVLSDSGHAGIINQARVTASFDGKLRPLSLPAKQLYDGVELIRHDGARALLLEAEVDSLILAFKRGFNRHTEGKITPASLNFLNLLEKLVNADRIAIDLKQGVGIDKAILDRLLEEIKQLETTIK